jgi:hypothetical protein
MVNYRDVPRDDYERAVFDLCAATITRRNDALKRRQLSAELRGIVQDGPDSAELVIDVIGEGGIVDVIEFQVTRDGQPVQRLDELAKWLDAAITDAG